VILTKELFTTPNEQLPYYIFVRGLYAFVFYYPLFMAYAWMWGALLFKNWYERRDFKKFPHNPLLTEYPLVSIIIPCYNEEDNVVEVIDHLSMMNYANYEIIAVNDGSKDKTGILLDQLCEKHKVLRVIHQAKNQGKAVGLNTATLVAKGEYLLCIDGDAVLDHECIGWMVRHFRNNPKLGAITGNPRIRTRSTLLGKIQVGEFSAIIGLIKRTQHILGSLFCVSGVCSMFRKQAVLEVGLWSTDMLTEDIDISWKLQIGGYKLGYEPRSVCWILMPETLKGLWSQRLRWSTGGVQTIVKYITIFKSFKHRGMWVVWAEYATSIVWAYALTALFFLWIYELFQITTFPNNFFGLLPGWHGLILAITCLLQFSVSLVIERKYDYGLRRHYFWIIWYPFAYWAITTIASIISVPKTILRNTGKRATWVSPDRGIQNNNSSALLNE
jgi:poly-beta-1,6-N-acetyl-D-glucosamine synthase